MIIGMAFRRQLLKTFKSTCLEHFSMLASLIGLVIALCVTTSMGLYFLSIIKLQFLVMQGSFWA
jgi:hypothetical protein